MAYKAIWTEISRCITFMMFWTGLASPPSIRLGFRFYDNTIIYIYICIYYSLHLNCNKSVFRNRMRNIQTYKTTTVEILFDLNILNVSTDWRARAGQLQTLPVDREDGASLEASVNSDRTRTSSYYQPAVGKVHGARRRRRRRRLADVAEAVVVITSASHHILVLISHATRVRSTFPRPAPTTTGPNNRLRVLSGI